MNENASSDNHLTFEWNEKAESLEIHGNREGLKHLAAMLQALLAKDENDHVHLMTPQWGGGELSSERQNQAATLINHVKIFHWKSTAATNEDRPGAASTSKSESE